MTHLKVKITTITIFLFTINSYSQLLAPFKLRYQSYIKGDVTMISNNIVNRVEYGSDANDPYYNHTSTAKINDEFEMQYIDIDDDKSTFSSSSATLTFANNAKPKIAYAGLYWSSTYKYEMGGMSKSSKYFSINEKRLPFNKIKIKFPNQTEYQEIEGQTIYDGFEQKEVKDFAPYAEYADITKQIQSLQDPTGVYTLANIRATQGRISGGVASGWTIFIVYEDPTKSGKFISSFDGFAGVTEKSTDINISGFQTLPKGAISAKIACAALEGDNNLLGDQLLFNSNKGNPQFLTLSNKLRTADNFFNSSITVEDKFQEGREPDSKNTLGYDACLLTVPNPNNSIISNNSTEATLRLKSVGDRYFMFFSSFSVEVTEPANLTVASKENLVVETPKIETPKITLAENNSKKPQETVAPVVEVVKTSQEIKQPVVDKSISENNTVENKIQTQPIVAESKKIITGKVTEINKTFVNGTEVKPVTSVTVGKVKETNKIVAGTVTQETVVRHAENIPSAIPEVNKTIIKHEIKQDIKPQIKQEVKEAILADKESMKDEILKGLEAEILSELKAEIKQEVKQEVKEEFKKEYQEQIKQQLKDQLKKELKAALVDAPTQKQQETTAQPKVATQEIEAVQQKEEVVQKTEIPVVEQLIQTKEIQQPKVATQEIEVVQQKEEVVQKTEIPVVEQLIQTKEITQPKAETQQTVIDNKQKEEKNSEEETSNTKKSKTLKPELDTSLAKEFFGSDRVQKAKGSEIIYTNLGTVSVGYYLVANVFKVKENVEKFVKSLKRKGLDPSTFVNLENGYTYVYISKVQNEEDAKQLFQSNFNGKYNDQLWILGVRRN